MRPHPSNVGLRRGNSFRVRCLRERRRCSATLKDGLSTPSVGLFRPAPWFKGAKRVHAFRLRRSRPPKCACGSDPPRPSHHRSFRIHPFSSAGSGRRSETRNRTCEFQDRTLSSPQARGKRVTQYAWLSSISIRAACSLLVQKTHAENGSLESSNQIADTHFQGICYQ